MAHKKVQDDFQRIAQATKGECKFLDVNCQNRTAADLLTNTIAIKVLASLDKSLAARYEQVYVKKVIVYKTTTKK